jgi:hypothetical protein
MAGVGKKQEQRIVHAAALPGRLSVAESTGERNREKILRRALHPTAKQKMKKKKELARHGAEIAGETERVSDTASSCCMLCAKAHACFGTSLVPTCLVGCQRADPSRGRWTLAATLAYAAIVRAVDMSRHHRGLQKTCIGVAGCTRGTQWRDARCSQAGQGPVPVELCQKWLTHVVRHAGRPWPAKWQGQTRLATAVACVLIDSRALARVAVCAQILTHMRKHALVGSVGWYAEALGQLPANTSVRCNPSRRARSSDWLARSHATRQAGHAA